MEGHWVWLGVGGAVAGIAFGYVVQAITQPPAGDAERGQDYRDLRTVAILATVLAVVFFGVTLIPRPPFARGAGLGIGFLVGAATALLASPFALRGGDALRRAGSATALAGWAVIGLAALALVFGDMALPTALGFALGTLLVCGLLRMGLGQRAGQRSDWFAMEGYAVWAITLAAAVAISTFGAASPVRRPELPTAVAGILVIASVIAVRLLGGERGRQRPGRAVGLAAALATAITLAAIALLAWRAFADWNLLWVALCGAAAATIAGWLIAGAGAGIGAMRSAALAAVVVIVALAVCFRLMGAYGAGIGLIVAWAIGLGMLNLALPGGDGRSESPPSRGFVRWLALGLAFLLYRLFSERYRDAVGHADLRTHYTMIGALLGIVLPMLYASWRAGAASAEEGRGAALLRAIGIGLAVALTPLVLAVLWSLKATLGLLGGVVAAQVILLLLPLLDGAGPSLATSWNLVALGMMTVAVVFCQSLQALPVLARAQKIYLALGVGVVLAIWALISGLLARWQRRPIEE
jgi:hypothetical protein